VRGEKTTWKQIIVARAFSAWERGVKPIPKTVEELKAKHIEEYNEKIVQFSLQDPNTFADNAWTDEVSQFTRIHLGKVFEFVGQIKSHMDLKEDSDDIFGYIGKYTKQKAYSYFESGFDDVVLTCVADDITYAKTVVLPSQRITDPERPLWIAFKSDGEVITVWCGCMAGLQSCNHVIAALYKIMVANCEGLVSPSVTSVACKWNHSTRREFVVKPLSQFIFRRDNILKAKKSALRLLDGSDETASHRNVECVTRETFVPEVPEDREPVPKEVTYKLHDELQKCCPGAVFAMSIRCNYMYATTCMSLPIPQLAENLLDDLSLEKRLQKNDVMSEFFHKTVMTDEEIDWIQKGTKGQSDNENWQQQRMGRWTASWHHQVFTKVNTSA
jgi:hypothetical protein